MAPNAPEVITFVVPGQEQPVDAGSTRGAAASPLPAGGSQGRLKQSVRVGAPRGGGGGQVRVTAVPGEDVVVLRIADGPELMLHPETARDLMLAQQSGIKRSRGVQGDTFEPGPGEVAVPVQMQWRGLELEVATRGGATRGPLGGVTLTAVDVITGLVKDPAADFVASEVVRRVDGQVEEGVYALKPDALSKLRDSGALLATVPAAPGGGPLLVFVHGTFSDTQGTFGKLWIQHPQRARSLFRYYDNRVYALDHRTLGVSPITNALSLAKALPRGARLHLVTHSRGGLVAEVLARVCGSPALDNLKLFPGREYASQRAELKELADLVKAQDIRVDRVVRVACPARGTLLASKRLDAYVSILKWTLGLAGIPVAPFLVDFLGEVARRRAEPEMLPGLAAQIPDSPLVQWLHAVDDVIPGELRVVAGDMQGDSITSWLKTLMADAFYWTDNDLVVQTRSMYGGAPRAAGATFLLDQGGAVSHFSYFSNERTAEAIVSAVTQPSPQGFRVIGPLSWAGESSTGVRGAAAAGGKPASEKPAVFLLPGILGSNLKIDGKRIWLGWRLLNGLKRLEYEAGQPDGVEPDGPISFSYQDLADFLADSHEVIEFAFDWRRPMEEEARRLAVAVEAALAAREKSGQPVRLIAHSMGGLVARTMQLERPQVWERMMAHSGARLLMLGTPNGGSWAPMQVLSGDDTFGNTIVAFGAPFQDYEARTLLAGFPGFLQLQASLLATGLGRNETWQELAKRDLESMGERSWWHSDERQLDAYRWGVPPQDVLDKAVALRQRLDAQREKSLDKYKDKLLLVVGRAHFTPDGYEIGDEGLFYLDAPEDGDGRVTRQSALLPGVRTWFLDCGHGGLANKKEAFAAYLEMLESGSTGRLDRLAEPVSARGASQPSSSPTHVRSRPSRRFAAALPPEIPRELLTPASPLPAGGPIAPAGAALRITVVNGDLSFVHQPLLLGHYRSLRLTGTERVMDRLIGGTMEEALQVGLYPDAPGTHQVFVNTSHDPENPWQLPRPQAVVVVGLGEEGKLKASELVGTVRQAVIAWAQRVAESAAGTTFELAATLIGSGGTGIEPVQSAQLIAQGVREANRRLADRGWPSVSHLSLIELYLDRASDAWRALQVQTLATPGLYQLTETVQTGTGALPRPLTSGYRGADYDFISATTKEGEYGNDSIVYTLDTKRARSEVRAQSMQGRLLRELVVRASSDRNHDAQIGRTLFNLLVPIEMEPFFGGTTELVIELDQGTAGIPWELLDSNAGGAGDSRPWAIRAKLLRKLRTAEFRDRVMDANADANVLVIGEPQCDPGLYPRLPGARNEANEVARFLMAPNALGPARVRALISPDDATQVGSDARTIVNAVLERDWRIVHIAGHGEPPEKIGPEPKKRDDPPQKDGDPRGVVLSNGTFLGPREIANMRVVPELVFVNCCYLAARNPNQLLREPEARFDRPRFAAGVAEKLIEVGVRCVIAAGWAVEDGPAKEFATRFYESVLRGERFIDAVATARSAARALGGNTWAAFQCYGDPDWSFKREGSDAQRPSQPPADELAGVASPPALELALETLAVQSKFQKADPETQRGKIRRLEARFSALWGNVGSVAEGFGAAWTGAKDIPRAIEWYERALRAADGSASLRAAEQLGNLRARLAWDSIDKARGNADVGALDEARTKIKGALAALELLVAVQPTTERESLCGSACKLLALVEETAKDAPAEAAAIERMKAHYQRAEEIARASQDANLFYPALNRMAAELILDTSPAGRQLDGTAVAEVRQNLAAKTRDNPDFWSMVSLTELRMYEALDRRHLSGELLVIEREYENLSARVSMGWMWESVYKQARFVLPKYAQRAGESEKEAVKALLSKLEGLAHPDGQ